MHKRSELLFHFIRLLMKLITPSGKKALIAENLALKQQLITLNRKRLRSPALTTFDRIFFGFLAHLIQQNQENRRDTQTCYHSEISPSPSKTKIPFTLFPKIIE